MKFRRRGGPRRNPVLSLNSIIPNILTVLALCAGMTSIRFALQENWQAAVAAILVAAVLDGLDGRLARLLKGATKFGAELDSLSDFIAFGVAPAIVTYLWSGHALGGIGWVATLAYATCCGLRLARFNVMLEDPDRPAWASDYFTGTAAPAAAGLMLLPMMASFQFGEAFFRHPVITAIWLLVVGLLMVSRLPTYSFKRMSLHREHVLATLLAVMLAAALLISYPWPMLSLLAVVFLASFPFSYYGHRTLVQAQKDERAAPEKDLAEETESEDEKQ